MQVIEALCWPDEVPHDHLHISRMGSFVMGSVGCGVEVSGRR
jgi:hypothetical protein